MGRTEISRIKDKLKRGTLSVFDIPEEFQNAAQIITLERKLSLREITRCGYDVISNLFLLKKIFTTRTKKEESSVVGLKNLRHTMIFWKDKSITMPAILF